MGTGSSLNDEREPHLTVQHAAGNILSRILKKIYVFFNSHIILVLLCLTSIGILLLLLGFHYISTEVIEMMALQEAKRTSKIMTEVRSLYTSEVVSPARMHGVRSTHKHKDSQGNIPLPATFTILLGQRLAESESQAQVRLYSNYPFPWRKDEGVKDEFEHAAWKYLQANPSQVYYRFEKNNSGTVLRYATADIMREACVDCHNTYPDTPKTDWKIGDVRGILEVVQPLDSVVVQLQHTLQGLFLIILVLGAVVMGSVVMVILKLRRHSKELKEGIAERTATLRRANQEMDRLISQHKAAEENFRGLLEFAPEAIVSIDEKGKIVLVNAQTEELFGYAREELLGQAVEILLPERDRGSHQAYCAEFMTRSWHMNHTMGRGRELVARCKDGRVCPVEISLGFLETPQGNVGMAFIRDITAKKKATKELQAVYAHTEQLLNSISSILIGVNEKGTVIRWNSLAELVFEIAGHDAVGKSFWDSPIGWDTQAWSTVSEAVGHVLRTKQPVQLEYLRILSAGRGERILGLTITPILVNHEQDAGFLILGSDITESKQNEEQVAKLHRLNKQILDSAGEGIYGLDIEGKVSFVNPAGAKMLGYQETELVGVSMHLTVHHTKSNGLPYPEEECPMYASFRDGIGRQIANEVLWRKDGTCFAVEYTSTPIYDNGILSGAVITFRDISQRQQLEAQLSLAQKMESIGQLAAGIAHEINTPTQFVSDNLRFLTESFQDLQKVLVVYDQVVHALPRDAVDAQLLETMETTLAEADLTYVAEEIPKALQQSLDGAERVGNIVRAMKEFSHPGTTEKKPVDLNQAIESTITVARNEWKYVAEVVTQLEPTLPLVPCLPGELNQVILNLLINAAHAIGDVVQQAEGQKGLITITTQRLAESVEIRIADTGAGIPEAARQKIFDPFFTTKEVGKGTGQGLAIAHDVIVNKHGGRLFFETEIGTGTTFVIQLPYQRSEVRS